MTSSPRRRRRIRLNALVGGFLTLVFVVVAVLGAFWTPYSGYTLAFGARLLPPSAAHWMGTDQFGRDVLSRIMIGASTSGMVSLITVVFALVVGTTVGVIAGFFRGPLERIIMACNDALQAFPGILLALGLLAILGASESGIVLALGFAYSPSVIRLMRATVMSLRTREYIEASFTMGNSRLYTIWRHILPNCVAPLIVYATSMYGWVILAEAGLSFLGLGVPPPAPTWGNMLSDARPFLQQAAWLGIFPGVCISVVLLGVNLFGDALRDYLDPRMKGTS